MATNTSTTATEGAEYLARSGFHKIFVLPATADHDALQVGYSDLGRQPTATADQDEPPVVLFIPGMFASRFHGLYMDVVGKKIGVRVLTVDRPGMGQSTDVKPKQRVAIWVELVPRLLAHLGVRHVSLVSHSAGGMYLLNTLYSCRDVLSLTRPYVALLAPWVDVQHSGVKLLQAARLLVPGAAFGSWNNLVKSIATKIGPAIGSSIGTIGKWLPKSTSASDAEFETSKNRLHWQSGYGLSTEFLDTAPDALLGAMFAENTVGANSEAMQCLKKQGDGTWGECEDFRVFVEKLVAQERSRTQEAKLRVKTLFAENDAIVGQQGQQYMEACWDKSEFADVLNFTSATVDGADHESLMIMAAVLENVLGDVVGENAAQGRSI
ncbi:hypothetical protein C2857_005959 [Epichloe festucae Fl1]|uniref:AB hydrolase-1 domain-containing protein n=1 Tax=Epichloe festucae (strain Fl1) TaxID=877507 RepID=A0A7S9KQ49_EPIFF|nr:hypothetical protein C2857_005959 [Epichloe festucae Fl1]